MLAAALLAGSAQTVTAAELPAAELVETAPVTEEAAEETEALFETEGATFEEEASKETVDGAQLEAEDDLPPVSANGTVNYTLVSKDPVYLNNGTVSLPDTAGSEADLLAELTNHPDRYLKTDLFATHSREAQTVIGFYVDSEYTKPLSVGTWTNGVYREEQHGSGTLSSRVIYARLIARYEMTLYPGKSGASMVPDSGDGKVTSISSGDVYSWRVETDEVDKKISMPVMSCPGFVFGGWEYGAKILSGKALLSGAMKELTARWVEGVRVEFRLYPNEAVEREAYLSDLAIRDSKFTALEFEDRQRSSMIRYQSTEWIDGYTEVQVGDTIGSGFTDHKSGEFTQTPSLDPVAEKGYRARFLGWRVSSAPGKVYTSDQLANLTVTGPTFVQAVWDDTTDFVTVHFIMGEDGKAKYLDNKLRRETEQAEFWYHVPQKKDLREMFFDKAGCTVRAIPANNADTFQGWAEMATPALETDWIYDATKDSHDIYLVPIILRNQTSKGVRFTSVKVGDKASEARMIQPTVGTTVSMTAGLLANTTGTIEWKVLDTEYKEIKKEGIITTLTKKKGKTSSFKAKKAGTVYIEISVRDGSVVYSDLLTVNVKGTVKGLVWTDSSGKELGTKADGVLLKSASFSETYQLTALRRMKIKYESGESAGRIYVTTTRGFADDDFFKIENLKTDPATGRHYILTESDGSGRIQVVTKNSEDSIYEFLGDGWQHKAHAGVTTLTLSTENGYKLDLRVIVAGYDEDSKQFIWTDGKAVRSQVRHLYGGEYSPLASGYGRDCWFDKEGIARIDVFGNTGGLIKRTDGSYILIDEKTRTEEYKNRWIKVAGEYQYGAGDDAPRYHISDQGVVQSGWYSVSGGVKYYAPATASRPFEPIVNDWIQLSGNRYYMDGYGFRVKGKKEIPFDSGNYYFFDNTANTKTPGKMLTGWVKEESGGVFWYDKGTGLRAPTTTISGGDAKKYPLIKDGGKFYYNSARGKVTGGPGWLIINADGTYNLYKNCPIDEVNVIAGENAFYVVDAAGELAHNRLVKTNEGTWYFGADCLPVLGAKTVDKVPYFFTGMKRMAAVDTDDTAGFYLEGGATPIYYHLEKSDTKTYRKWTDENKNVLDQVWAENRAQTERFYIVKGTMVTGWRKIAGQKYYFNPDATLKKPTGTAALMEISGKKYYLDTNGMLLVKKWGVPGVGPSDLPTGAEFYTGAAGIPLCGRQTITVGGVKKTFFFNTQNGKKFSDRLIRVGKTLYLLDADGAVATRSSAGWNDPATKDYYVTKAGTVKTGWVTVNEGSKKTYYYTADGEKMSGLQVKTFNKAIYYFDPADGDARKENAWVDDGSGKRYYNNVGKALVGRKKVNGSFYIFDENGICYEDCYVRIGNMVYHQGIGGAQTSITEGTVRAVDGEEYRVKNNGKIVTGLVKVKDTTSLYLAGTGIRARSGFYKVAAKKWAYFDEDGIMQKTVNATVQRVGEHVATGNLLFKLEKKTGYITGFMDDQGKVLKNAVVTLGDGEQYIIGAGGGIATGWYSYQNPNTMRRYRYYIASSGKLSVTQTQNLTDKQTNKRPFIKVDGKYYYQDEDGVALASVADVEEMYCLDENGSLRAFFVNKQGEVQFSKKVTVNNRMTFIDENGYPATGWFFDDNSWYYAVNGHPLHSEKISACESGMIIRTDTYEDETLADFRNTVTGDPLRAICEVGYNGKQSVVWKDTDDKLINGTFERVGEDGKTVTVYTFEKGVMKTGDVTVFDSASHQKVKMTFDKYTGKAKYKK